MSKPQSRFAAFLSGLAKMVDIWPAGRVEGYRHKDELSALRGDTQRIGDDMREMIARPVEGAVDMDALRRKVMDRHPVVRAHLGKKA